MSSNYNPKEPAWDTSEDGVLPSHLVAAFGNSRKLTSKQEALVSELESLSDDERLSRLDAMQEEAMKLADSRGQDLMTNEQQFVYTWQRELTVAKASLEVFSDLDNQVEEREEKIKDCRRRAAIALYKLGKSEEALAYAEPFPDLIEKIRFVQAAKEYDDEDFLTHSCEREQAEQDGKTISLDRRWNSEDVLSELHGGLVHVWVCNQCGMANAVPDTPERQARYDASMLAQIHAAAKGDRPNAKGIAKTLPQMEAGILLAK